MRVCARTALQEALTPILRCMRAYVGVYVSHFTYRTDSIRRRRRRGERYEEQQLTSYQHILLLFFLNISNSIHTTNYFHCNADTGSDRNISESEYPVDILACIIFTYQSTVGVGSGVGSIIISRCDDIGMAPICHCVRVDIFLWPMCIL